MNRADALSPALPEAGAATAPRIATVTSELPRLAIILAALAVPPAVFSGDPFVLNIIAYTYLFAGLATAWNIIGGYGGQFSLGHAVYFAIGAYTAANLFLRWGISPWIALLPAVVISVVVASLISWPTFRLRGKFFAIATLAFNEVAFVLANFYSGITGGPRGLTVPFQPGLINMIFRDRLSYTMLMLGFLALCLLVSLVVLRSRLGYSLQAVRDEQDTARAVGIDVTAVKLQGMAISAGLTAMGGVLFMMYVRIVDPPTLFSLPDIGVKFLLLVLIGGLGTLYGPLVGALLIVPLEFFLRSQLGGLWPGTHLAVLGMMLILAALFMKRGVIGALSDLLTWGRARGGGK